ncbi:MAG: hypothetical protein ACE37F_28560 [Nannocystaceae bacterium]|nr:hypothetical protein [bacterium]
MELVILPFFIPLILIGRFVDAWRAWRGTEFEPALEPSSEAQWADTWGRMLNGEALAPGPAHRT